MADKSILSYNICSHVADKSFNQVGTGVTNLLINIRKAIDKSFAGEAEDLPVLATSVGYGVYMAVSSNLRYVYVCGFYKPFITSNIESILQPKKYVWFIWFNRYQIIAGIIEQRILEPLLHQNKVVLGAVCFAVRTGNTFLGSLM